MLWLLACTGKGADSGPLDSATPTDTAPTDSEQADSPTDSPVDSPSDSRPEDTDSGLGDTGPDTSACDVVVPDDRPTIQNAIYEAEGGETICVRAGTWPGRLDLIKKSLDLVALEGPYKTIVEGEEGGQALWVHYGETTTLSGFTFRTGETVVVVEGSTVTLTDCVIRDGYCEEYYGCGGQGLYAYQADLTLERVEVRDNTGASSAYSNSGVGMRIADSTASLTDVLVADSQALGSSYYGGVVGLGVLVTDSDVTATRLQVVGGVPDTPTSAYGMGIAVTNGSTFEGTNVVVAGNATDLDGVYGAGLYANASAVSLVNSVIRGNGAAGLAANGGALGASSSSLTLHNTSVEDESETGPVWSDDSSTVDATYTNVWAASGAEALEGEGNLQVDPGFTDTSAEHAEDWDLTLDPSSDLVDAGDPGLSDLDGTRSDVGAHGGPHAWP